MGSSSGCTQMSIIISILLFWIVLCILGSGHPSHLPILLSTMIGHVEWMHENNDRSSFLKIRVNWSHTACTLQSGVFGVRHEEGKWNGWAGWLAVSSWLEFLQKKKEQKYSCQLCEFQISLHLALPSQLLLFWYLSFITLFPYKSGHSICWQSGFWICNYWNKRRWQFELSVWNIPSRHSVPLSVSLTAK